MQALQHWPLAERRLVGGVFTDIDDTLTSEGRITADALQALHALKAAGLCVVATTGRPIGWCEGLANGDALRGLAPWPVDALVAENGALAWVGEPGKRHKIYRQSAAERALNQERMQAVAKRIATEIPAAQITRDSTGRETDLAIDHGEFTRLSESEIARVVALMQAEGMHTTVSSIHTHGCYGQFNKWTGAEWIVQQLWQRKLVDELRHWVFVGDSGNDVAMFQHFQHSVGVANISAVAPTLPHLPRYISPSERGAGFAEVARALLEARP